jgi:ribonuclease E
VTTTAASAETIPASAPADNTAALSPVVAVASDDLAVAPADAPAAISTGAVDTEQTAENRSRSRRSPRHLRAAGQKRKKEQQGDIEADSAVEARYPEIEQTEFAQSQSEESVHYAETASIVAAAVVNNLAEDATTPVSSKKTKTHAKTREAETVTEDTAQPIITENAVVAAETVANNPVVTEVVAATTQPAVTEEAVATVVVSNEVVSNEVVANEVVANEVASTDGVSTEAVVAGSPVANDTANQADSVVAASPTAVETTAVETTAAVETASTVASEATPSVEAIPAIAPAPAVVSTPVTRPAQTNRYGNMVTSTMTKPVASVDESVAVTPEAKPVSERPVVVSSQRSAGSTTARQMTTAPMTKPASVDE